MDDLEDMDQAYFPCPVCGEENSTDPETLQEEGRVVQDCWVCCRPLVLHWEQGELVAEAE